MYLQEILEVAIGLVFGWLVMSVAAMSLQEWIGNALKWRSTDLQKNIKSLLSNTDLADEIYKHPLVAALYNPSKNEKKDPRLPSYIPSGKFASALFDVVVQAGTNESPIKTFTSEIGRQLQVMRDPGQQQVAQEDWDTILATVKQVAASGAGQNAVDTLKLQVQGYGTKYPELQGAVDLLLPQVDAYYKDFQAEQHAAEPEADLTMRQFRLGLKALAYAGDRDPGNGEKKKLKETIEAILRSAQVSAEKGEAAVAKVRKEFESWFNDSMDRLSGTYKRKAQLTSFIIGVVLAIFMNVDSINLATSLWREPTLRQAIVAQAQDYATTNQQVPGAKTDSSGATVNPVQNIQELQVQLGALNIPFGWTSQPLLLDASVPCTAAAPSKYNKQGVATQIMGVRIGSNCYPLINTPPFNADNILVWLTKIMGMVITGAAAAQGAPFWFDILKKMVNVRSSGIKPEEKKAVG